MHVHATRIEQFYAAFQRRDGASMAACYHPEATFSDPVFQGLSGVEPGEMWRMLCHRARDLDVVFDGVDADDTRGRAHWVATYTFGATGNKVVNDIAASFEFRDGLFVRHEDQFDLTRWAGMALGWKGRLLGWTPMMQGAIRKQARAGLTAWMASQPR